MEFIVKIRLYIDNLFKSIPFGKMGDGLLKLLKMITPTTIKDIFLVIIVILAISFGLLWFFKDDNKQLIKKLENDAKTLKSERVVIQFQIDSLKKENQKLNIDKQKIEDILNQDNISITTYINKANKSKQDLENLKQQQSEISQKIDEIKNHPPNRQDDELLSSLRKHLDERMKNKK